MSEFLISILLANISNHMAYLNSVIVTVEKFFGLRQLSLSIILKFNGVVGIRRNVCLNFISWSYSTVKLRITCKIKLHIDLFRKSILLLSVVWLVCQVKWNLDNGKVINQFKLWTGNKYTVDMDIAIRKPIYEIWNKFFTEMNTQISVLLTIYICVNIICYRALIKIS